MLQAFSYKNTQYIMKKIIVTLSIIITSCISMMATPVGKANSTYHPNHPAMHCVCHVCRSITRDLAYHNRPGARPCDCRRCHGLMSRLNHHHRMCQYDCRRPEPHRMGNHRPGTNHYDMRHGDRRDYYRR